MSTKRNAAPSLETRPEDPAAFVAEAERITNERDVEAMFAVYSDNIVVDLVTDGIHEQYSGLEHVIQGWRATTAAMASRNLLVRKTVLAVGDGVIVNSWTGSVAGREGARGLDIWHFEPGGRVREHQLYTFLHVRPSTNPLARIQFALTQPKTALALLREQHRIGVKPVSHRKFWSIRPGTSHHRAHLSVVDPGGNPAAATTTRTLGAAPSAGWRMAQPREAR